MKEQLKYGWNRLTADWRPHIEQAVAPGYRQGDASVLDSVVRLFFPLDDVRLDRDLWAIVQQRTCHHWCHDHCAIDVAHHVPGQRAG